MGTPKNSCQIDISNIQTLVVQHVGQFLAIIGLIIIFANIFIIWQINSYQASVVYHKSTKIPALFTYQHVWSMLLWRSNSSAWVCQRVPTNFVHRVSVVLNEQPSRNSHGSRNMKSLDTQTVFHSYMLYNILKYFITVNNVTVCAKVDWNWMREGWSSW